MYMYKLATRSYGYKLQILSKIENLHLASKYGTFEDFWQFQGHSPLGVNGDHGIIGLE